MALFVFSPDGQDDGMQDAMRQTAEIASCKKSEM